MARRHEIRQGVVIVTSDRMPAPTPITENPKVSLYTYLPPGSKCAFSRHAREPALKHPLPDRDAPPIWSPQKIRDVAWQIRSRHYDAVEGMTKPRDWEDLHQYFHPIDLWHDGASNLRKVVYRLLKENQICEWVELWLTLEHNRYKLSLWDLSNDILSVFDSSDWYEIYTYGYTILEGYFVFLREVMEYWYHFHRNPPIVATNSPSTAATYISPNIVTIAPPEDSLHPVCQGDPVTLSAQGNSSLTVTRPPVTRTTSASIQAMVPDFIPSVRRSSSEHHNKPFASNLETPANSELVKKTNKVQHQPSKSGPIPESELNKLQVETGIAGPSRLPSRVSQQMPVPSKPAANIAEVLHAGNVVPAEPQVGSAKVDTQARDQNTSGHVTSGRLSDQALAVSQEQVQKKKKGADEKPKNGWSHSRNDPIHGPIRQHHKQPQGNSSTSTYQKLNRDNHYTSAHRAAARSVPQCPNYGKSGPQAVWERCECALCSRKNRSVRIRLGKELFSPVKAKVVEEYLEQFGSIESFSTSAKYMNGTVGYATYRKEEGALKAVKMGNGAQIYDGTGCLRLDLQHPWVSKYWRCEPQQRDAETGPQLNNEQPQLLERTPSATSSQRAGHLGSGGLAQLHNGPNGSRHPSTPESDPFVGGNSRNYTNMLQHSHSSHHSHHPPHPPHLQHPQHPHGHAPVPYRMPAQFNPTQPISFHPPHMPHTSPSHFVPAYGPPPPFGSGPPVVQPVVSPAHLPGPPRTHLLPQGFGFPPVHHQPSMQMIYTPWPEQPPHPSYPGFPSQHGHVPIHNGQPVGPPVRPLSRPPPGPPAKTLNRAPKGAPTGPRAEQMTIQSTNGIGQPDIEHRRGGCVHAPTKKSAGMSLFQERELPSARSSNSSSPHDIPMRLPPSRQTSEEIRLEQQRASAPQQSLNDEGHQAGVYQEGRGHHETHIVGD